MAKDRLLAALEGTKIPSYMWDGLVDYIVDGIPTGGFLRAILTNDLKAACYAADDANKGCIYDYVFFLVNHAPAACWGSPERVKHWGQVAQQIKKQMQSLDEGGISFNDWNGENHVKGGK